MRASLLKAAAAIGSVAVVLATQAAAHVVFTPNESHPKAYFAGTLRVSHGCAGSPTTSLRVDIPAGINNAKPQPKPGWVITTEHAALDTPITGEGGQKITQRVTSITWTGRLPDDEYDEFGVFMKLPDLSGPLYFPVTQSCENGVNLWKDLPSDQHGDAKPSRPAPSLNLVPIDAVPADMGGMDMSHMNH